MDKQDIRHLRNIGIMAHIDAGKTTTTERILYFTGLTHKIGEVHDGNTVMDWMSQEQERGITITSASTSCDWKDHHINIIDTPGHVDFTVEVERCLRILDGAIFLLDAKEGVEAQTKVVWHQADHYNVPRLIFINKMDTIGADFERSVETARTELGANPVPIQIPIGAEKEFQAVISLVDMKMYTNTGDLGENLIENTIPDEHMEMALDYRKQLLESIADEDDELLMLYLDGEEIPSELLIKAIRQATLEGSLTPVLCGSAFKNKGVQLLLDAVIDYLPSPLERPEIRGMSPQHNPDISETEKDHEIIRQPDDTEPFTALIFKVMSDPYVGRLAYLRVYSGHVTTGKSILNVSKDKKVRLSKLLRMHANHRTETDHAQTGDIVAAIGLKFAGTGDTLSDPSHPILLESIDFPEPVISRALEPKRPGDFDKMRESLEQLTQEDPTLTIHQDEDTGQTLLSGMGELHLEIIIDRLVQEFGVKVNTGNPRVNYRETITRPVTAEYEFAPASGGQHDYAFVKLNAAPRKRGEGHLIHTSAKDRKVPKEMIEAAEEGIRRSLASGILMGYEVIDLDIDICELGYSEEHSTDVAFITAAAFALNEALDKGKSQLLEPYFEVSVNAPEAYIGDIMDDIKKRKGIITAIESLPKHNKIIATVPLSKMFGYATDVRSITRGNGHYTMIFSHYDVTVE